MSDQRNGRNTSFWPWEETLSLQLAWISLIPEALKFIKLLQSRRLSDKNQGHTLPDTLRPKPDRLPAIWTERLLGKVFVPGILETIQSLPKGQTRATFSLVLFHAPRVYSSLLCLSLTLDSVHLV